jgi:hypothetical protein
LNCSISPKAALLRSQGARSCRPAIDLIWLVIAAATGGSRGPRGSDPYRARSCSSRCPRGDLRAPRRGRGHGPLRIPTRVIDSVPRRAQPSIGGHVSIYPITVYIPPIVFGLCFAGATGSPSRSSAPFPARRLRMRNADGHPGVRHEVDSAALLRTTIRRVTCAPGSRYARNQTPGGRCVAGSAPDDVVGPASKTRPRYVPSTTLQIEERQVNRPRVRQRERDARQSVVRIGCDRRQGHFGDRRAARSSSVNRVASAVSGLRTKSARVHGDGGKHESSPWPRHFASTAAHTASRRGRGRFVAGEKVTGLRPPAPGQDGERKEQAMRLKRFEIMRAPDSRSNLSLRIVSRISSEG